jgi:hypothetical protein
VFGLPVAKQLAPFQNADVEKISVRLSPERSLRVSFRQKRLRASAQSDTIERKIAGKATTEDYDTPQPLPTRQDFGGNWWAHVPSLRIVA